MLVCAARREMSNQWCSLGIDVADAHIWVGLVYKGVEHLHGLPDSHAGTAAVLEVDSSLDVECNSLLFCGDCHVIGVRLWYGKQSGTVSYHVAPYRSF